jgi:kynurenine formamidase
MSLDTDSNDGLAYAAPGTKEAWTQRLSNWARFGADDELGTLNYITPAKIVEAARLVRHGRVVSLSRVIATKHGAGRSPKASLRMLRNAMPLDMFTDVLTIEPHGPDVTHLDALGHAADAGLFYGGRELSEVVHRGQLRHLSVASLAGGVMTRGVLLDVAAATGVPFLPAGRGVSADDLTRAEEQAGLRVEAGDAVVVRIGADPAQAKQGPSAGLTLSAIEWLAERRVSVYTGDCIERLPSELAELPLPLHTLGIVYLGLVIVDNPDLDALVQACHDLALNEFLFSIAPIPLAGATGCPINPLCTF